MTTRVIEEWLKKIENDWRDPPADYARDFQGADHEVDHFCQYPVPTDWYPDGLSDCGELAAYWLWWGGDDSGMYICERHASKIEEKEEAND